jgi:hypothetical protein
MAGQAAKGIAQGVRRDVGQPRLFADAIQHADHTDKTAIAPIIREEVAISSLADRAAAQWRRARSPESARRIGRVPVGGVALRERLAAAIGGSPMTDEMMDLRTPVEKAPDADILREHYRLRRRAADGDGGRGEDGRGAGERSPDRLAQRRYHDVPGGAERPLFWEDAHGTVSIDEHGPDAQPSPR